MRITCMYICKIYQIQECTSANSVMIIAAACHYLLDCRFAGDCRPFPDCLTVHSLIAA